MRNAIVGRGTKRTRSTAAMRGRAHEARGPPAAAQKPTEAWVEPTFSLL
jgi:hypothetical protein